jgi:hypothetical protein
MATNVIDTAFHTESSTFPARCPAHQLDGAQRQQLAIEVLAGNGDCLATGQKTTLSSSLKRLFTLWILAGRLSYTPTPGVMVVRLDNSQQKGSSVKTLPSCHLTRLREICVLYEGGTEPEDVASAQVTKKGCDGGLEKR